MRPRGEETSVAEHVPSAEADDRTRRMRRRLRQTMHEFAAVPLAAIFLFLVLASVSIAIDKSHAAC